MSSMSAWSMPLDDQQIWDTVAFIERLPTLSPQGYAEATRLGQDELRQLQKNRNLTPISPVYSLSPAEYSRP